MIRRRGFRAAAAFAAAVLCAAPAAWAETAVRITGNAALGERILREAAAEELRDLADPARRRAAAADAAFQMESAGRRAGYAFIEVEHGIRGDDPGAEVVFAVREGPLVRLGTVRFSGNAFLAGERLRALAAPGENIPFVAADIAAARRAMVQLYRDEGFTEVAVPEPRVSFSQDRALADVQFEIVEGTRNVIRGVVCEGDALPEGDPALQRLAAALPGQPYFPRRKPLLAAGVGQAFAAKGYPEADVSVREGRGPEPGDVTLTVAVAAGPRVRVGRLEIAGNVRTREDLIRSRIPIRPGDWFSEEAVHDGFRELYRTGLFSRVSHALEGDGAERVLRIEVEEALSREVSGEIGWGSYERLRGHLAYRDRNVFGTGRSAGAEAGVSTKGRYLKADLLDPLFLGSKVTLSVPFSWKYREEPSYTEEVLELSARVYRLLRRRVVVGLQYGFTFNGISHLSPDLPADARDEQHTVASVKGNVEIDRRDDLFYPERGWQAGLAAEVADERVGGSLNYLRGSAAAKLFHPLGAGFVLGLRLDTGFIVPTRGSEDIPVNLRFFTGGENSVRSFKEQTLGPKGPTGDPLGGLASTVASVEVRRRIRGNLAGSVFVDAGNVSPNRSLDDFGEQHKATADYVDEMWADYLRDFRTGVGVGLQYLTPVGPIRLDAAWNPAPRDTEAEDAFVYHLGIGMAF